MRTRQHLRRRCQRQERQWDARQALDEFAEFVKREDSGVLPAMEAIAATATQMLPLRGCGLRKPNFGVSLIAFASWGSPSWRGEARRRRYPKPQASIHLSPRNRCMPSCTILHRWNRVELYNEVWDQPLVKLSQKYGISDVRLGKVCRKLKYPTPDEATGRRGKLAYPLSGCRYRSSTTRQLCGE